MTLDKPLCVRLLELWRSVEQSRLSRDEFAAIEERELDQYAASWTRALRLSGQVDLVASTLYEIGRWRGIDDLASVRRRCENATGSLKVSWERTVPEIDARQVEKFYDAADDYIEELMWWHTLRDDNSPLAYVAALESAVAANCKSYLDFGSGVGSGGLLFASHGFDVTLADISGVMLSFCKFRFDARSREASFIDLKERGLPPAAYDFVTAMDVFEHLVAPVEAVDSLARCLKPGGFVYGRFAAEIDRERPQHIVQDFQPVFDRFSELGFKEVFRDQWLWGHQLFQKTGLV